MKQNLKIKFSGGDMDGMVLNSFKSMGMNFNGDELANGAVYLHKFHEGDEVVMNNQLYRYTEHSETFIFLGACVL